jgi:hypothetical protein
MCNRLPMPHWTAKADRSVEEIVQSIQCHYFDFGPFKHTIVNAQVVFYTRTITL